MVHVKHSRMMWRVCLHLRLLRSQTHYLNRAQASGMESTKCCKAAPQLCSTGLADCIRCMKNSFAKQMDLVSQHLETQILFGLTGLDSVILPTVLNRFDCNRLCWWVNRNYLVHNPFICFFGSVSSLEHFPLGPFKEERFVAKRTLAK